MTFDSELILLTPNAPTKDKYGNTVLTHTEELIMCHEQALTRSEFYSAGVTGLKAMYALAVNEFEYDGQKQVKYKGQVLEVLKTYPLPKGLLELTVGEKLGND